jgi:hypothetical protein
MKKIYFVLMLAIVVSFSVKAQPNEDALMSEYVPVVASKIQASNIPASISKDVNTLFDKDNPLTWSKFPYKFKDFGWVYEVGNPEKKLSRYEVSIKTSRGGFLWGRYNADGDLVETKEISENIAVPKYILDALYTGPYKDWKIVGNKEVVNFYQNKDNPTAEQNFKLNIEKGNMKKKLAFQYEANSGKIQARLIR